jgi:hypothetical protein
MEVEGGKQPEKGSLDIMYEPRVCNIYVYIYKYIYIYTHTQHTHTHPHLHISYGFLSENLSLGSGPSIVEFARGNT